MKHYHFDTQLAQLGNRKDPELGSISSPIHLSTTYAHPGMGQSTGYDYTRTKNPTRNTLEEGLARMENGSHAVATSSGMSAIQLVFQLFEPGAKIIASRDLYGGSYRYFQWLEDQGQATFYYFDTEEDFEELISDEITAAFIETPTNPLMQVVDIERLAKLTQAHDVCLIVDNTLLTPVRQKPLDLGAQIVVHSGTKFLTGHNDILAGVVVTNVEAYGERLVWLANTTGPCLSPFDSWLFIRSLKTLPLRFERQEATTLYLVEQLKQLEEVKEVLYAGVGAMLSIKLTSEAKVTSFLEAIRLFTYAESLGGVESLITYPTTQTHADIPQELRESYGLTPDLVRISVGLEDPEDLLEDLKQALKA
ncbi:aminotransferase class I/II-fold pyridoxal phosphate-dependent enzyme [Hutsoniella sourekii]